MDTGRPSQFHPCFATTNTSYQQVGTVLAYGGVITVIWAHCTPVHKNWQVYPNPGGQYLHSQPSISTLTGNRRVYFGCCQLSYSGGPQHCVSDDIGVVGSCLLTNIRTDLVIVSIPVPLLWTVKLSIKRKLIIGVLLCSGVFIMIATLLRCILSLRYNTSLCWTVLRSI